jgi:tripartite ATP-independent transporter DctM subunit
MVEMSPELITILMFGGVLVGIFLGYPLGIVLGGVSMIIGFLSIGEPIFNLFRMRLLTFVTDYVLLAVPMFIFMGVIVEKSGAAEKLYGGLYSWFGGLRGGLAIATILMGVLLAACVGVIAASVITMALIALPSMIKRKYSKELACGTVCAAGSLGILIPPSVMLVLYGPMSGISVGKLLIGAIVPGLILAGLYVIYTVIRCWLSPKMAPPIPIEERAIPLSKKINILVTGILPPLFLITAVLGSIFFGIAAPTEAASVGCLAAVLLGVVYRNFNWQTLKEATLQTMKVTCMAFFIAFGATMFTGAFLKLGGGDVVTNLLLSAPGGRWGVFTLIMFIIFILGMFIDWIGILFITVPLITPIGDTLGFDPLWFAMMVCVNLQLSFLTPPFAYAIFYLKGIAKPEWEIDTSHIIRGVIPFILLIMVGLGLLVLFPQLILWLPRLMVKF